jgi:hypothetical protein
VPLIYEKRLQGPPGATPKNWPFWLKNGSRVNTLIEEQISPPLGFPHQFYFHPSFLGGGFSRVSKLDEGHSPKSLGFSSLSPFSPLSYRFFAACLHNEIAIKLATMAPVTGMENFPSFLISSVVYFFASSFKIFQKDKFFQGICPPGNCGSPRGAKKL